MKKIIFEGACVALVTPFNDSGVNYEVMGEMIEFQIENDIDAILVCGTTGEASTMPDEEHKQVIKYAVEKINGRVPVIAGTGSNDTSHAVELSQYARDVGADAVLSVTPYYNKTTQKGLYMHFKTIAESIDIPVILYNIPSRTNLNINPPTLKMLSEIENIVAMKECNVSQVVDVAKLCRDDLTIYSGDDNQVIPMLALGGKGLISTMANIIPKDAHLIVDKFLSGDIVGSRELQFKALDLINALFTEVNPTPVKTALRLMGFDVGPCRMPLIEMEEHNIDILKKALENYGLI